MDFQKTLEQIEEFQIPLLGVVTNQNQSNSFSSLSFTSFGDRQTTLKTKRHYEHSALPWEQEGESREDARHQFLDSVGNSPEDTNSSRGKSSKPAIKVNSQNGNGRFEHPTDTRQQPNDPYDHWKN